MPHQQLYNKTFPGAGNDPKEFLQSVVKEHPYFSLAHFFLLKETAATDASYQETAAKTALHFNHPFLLRYQLNKKPGQVEQPFIADEAAISPPVDTITFDNSVQPGTDLQPESPEKEMLPKPQETAEEQEAESPVQPELPITTAAEKKPAKEELLFEPLHTTDYFASQGIKLSEEVQAGDKLGKQLRSFTDWLKTMKKLHHGKLPEPGNIDQVVQNMAEKSNKEQEVITEAMAEVYAQQGKTGKAGEIYRKLSLLNPSKSAYFAAKLELLKEN